MSRIIMPNTIQFEAILFRTILFGTILSKIILSARHTQGSGAPVLDMIPTESSEDCLHLNIWTPVVRPFCAFDCNPRTVILFFYGRNFEHGFNNQDLYDGRALSARGNVLVVVPNYRLGVFGFLNAQTADAPGNVGLLDMLLALKWVQENIEAFAGDPRNARHFLHSAV
ncbi:hypothetical protein HPB47_007295 [Ixodes persulcatus]|uniref:Uncharacterized protein n=1 Tax=Ixodes persulcatus TaxID=34615 RepID=A0AC60P897_IXOPE|nr:hypothetical protein HPB47_007295 [Ixodes persulcatus]